MATLPPVVTRKLKAYSALKKIAALVEVEYPHLRNASLSKIIARLSPRRHSPDFRSVVWDGKHYIFTPGQAAIVEVLWKALNRGTPKVGAGPLLHAADLVSDKVSKLFAGHPAWGTMIMTDGVGVYWLAD
ncbi:MAG: hypothetical protein JNJ77_19840 [Planctomycetia bacterium]|nr:hypothetical protein [Planctomycetia bacterium]